VKADTRVAQEGFGIDAVQESDAMAALDQFDRDRFERIEVAEVCRTYNTEVRHELDLCDILSARAGWHAPRSAGKMIAEGIGYLRDGYNNEPLRTQAEKAGSVFSIMIIHMLIFSYITGKGRASWVHKSYKAAP
jgi:hypothetical protein